MDLRRERLLPLDGIRGAAALSVALTHYSFLFTGDFYGTHFWKWGYLSVDLFFILSGIVLCGLYEKAVMGTGDGKPFPFGAFLRIRLARLWPLNALALLLLAAGVVWRILIHPGGGAAVGITGKHWLANLLPSLFTLQGLGVPPNLYWNEPAWSVSAELLVNVGWFFLAARRWNRTGVHLGIILLTPLFMMASFTLLNRLSFGLTYRFSSGVPALLLNMGNLRAAVGFSIGALLWRWVLAPGRVKRLSVGAATAAGSAVLLILAGVDAGLLPLLPTVPGIDCAVVFVLFPLLIWSALREGSLPNRLFSSGPMVQLGEISYSVYLLQFPLWTFVSLCGARAIPRPWIGPLFIALLLVVSDLCQRWFEVPARAWLRGRGKAGIPAVPTPAAP